MKKNILQVLFVLSIILKGLDGLAEFTGGLIFVLLKKREILDIISTILHYNLFKISNETVAHWIDYLSHVLTTNVSVLITIILICNGFLKMLLSINLLLKKKWAFYFAMIFLILLILYQLIEAFYVKSLVFNLFNGFDILVVIVIWLQYKHLMKTRGFR